MGTLLSKIEDGPRRIDVLTFFCAAALSTQFPCSRQIQHARMTLLLMWRVDRITCSSIGRISKKMSASFLGDMCRVRFRETWTSWIGKKVVTPISRNFSLKFFILHLHFPFHHLLCWTSISIIYTLSPTMIILKRRFWLFCCFVTIFGNVVDVIFPWYPIFFSSSHIPAC